MCLESFDLAAINRLRSPDLTTNQLSMVSTMTEAAKKFVRFQQKNEESEDEHEKDVKFKQSYIQKKPQIKAIVKSFRDKNDPYMRMTSRYELKKDADDRDIGKIQNRK